MLFFQSLLWDDKEVSLDFSNLPPWMSFRCPPVFNTSSEPQLRREFLSDKAVRWEFAV